MICPERTEASFTEKENTRRIIERISALNQPILFCFLIFSLPYFQTNNITILNINMVKIEKVKVREKKKQLLAAANYQNFQETGHWSLWNNVTGIS